MAGAEGRVRASRLRKSAATISAVARIGGPRRLKSADRRAYARRVAPGKINKMKLRDAFKDYKPPTE